jgi:hypothetical protein
VPRGPAVYDSVVKGEKAEAVGFRDKACSITNMLGEMTSKVVPVGWPRWLTQVLSGCRFCDKPSKRVLILVDSKVSVDGPNAMQGPQDGKDLEVLGSGHKVRFRG